MTYDFTKKELNFIIENANFTNRQLEIFNRLTDKRGRQTVVQMSMEMNVSTRTIDREIKKIKNKIYKIL